MTGRQGEPSLAPVRPPEASLRSAWLTLSVVSLASFLSSVNTSTLNVALPTISSHFSASGGAASTLVVTYQSVVTILLLFFGRLADLRGRRGMYLTGVAIFTAASLVLGFAPTIETLIALRAVQSLGAALIVANSAALVSDAFPRERLGQGMGLYVATFSIASLVGPIAGGWVTQVWGWQWLFWANVPLGLLCFGWAWVALRPPPRARPEGVGLNLVGNLLAALGIGGALLGLTRVSQDGWAAPLVVAALGVAVAAMVLLVAWERRVPHPLIDLRLFRIRSFSLGLVGAFLGTVSRLSPILLLSLYFQTVRGYDALETGTLVMPMVLASLVGPLAYSALAHRVPARLAAQAAGWVATAGLAVLMLSCGADSPLLAIGVGQVLVGLGFHAFLPANTTTMLTPLHADRLGIASAMRLTAVNVAVAAGMALSMSLVVTFTDPSEKQSVFAGTITWLHPEALPDVVAGFHLAYAVFTLLSLVGAVVAHLDRAPSAAPARN